MHKMHACLKFDVLYTRRDLSKKEKLCIVADLCPCEFNCVFMCACVNLWVDGLSHLQQALTKVCTSLTTHTHLHGTPLTESSRFSFTSHHPLIDTTLSSSLMSHSFVWVFLAFALSKWSQ